MISYHIRSATSAAQIPQEQRIGIILKLSSTVVAQSHRVWDTVILTVFLSLSHRFIDGPSRSRWFGSATANSPEVAEIKKKHMKETLCKNWFVLTVLDHN